MMKVEMFNGAELEVGEEIRFADLWQTEDGDVVELLESECVHVANGEYDEPIIADFEIVAEDKENPVSTLVKITDIR
nr:MAG TPA: hypothetical protein [Bacteriophage sp.]DAV15990.1 MAG TPA: hypothetical protein [Caudoviricetes sp.]